MKAKRIIVAVTNDLTYDQRMRRICNSLHNHGYEVTLVGRSKNASAKLSDEPYSQILLYTIFQNGFWFYGIYNIRLCWYLLWNSFDAGLAVDYDTLPAFACACRLKHKKLLIDCHEWYEEAPELIKRAFTRKFWQLVGKGLLPLINRGFSVTDTLARHFQQVSGRPFATVRNFPWLKSYPNLPRNPRLLIYQGVLNQDRGLPELIQAMKLLPDYTLWLCGEGDIQAELVNLMHDLRLDNQIIFWGNLPLEELHLKTAQAWVGLNLLTGTSKSYYFSLANKFFDYVQAGTPVITVDYPEYQAHLSVYQVGLTLSQVSPDVIAQTIIDLAANPQFYRQLEQNCWQARQHWIWEVEQNKLLSAVDQELRPPL